MTQTRSKPSSRRRRPEPPAVDPTTAYARAVVAGKIVTGRLVRLACERHLGDLKDGAARGIRFDVGKAARAMQFVGLLHLPDGKPFTLQPFQLFIVGNIFGWLGEDGCRRFRTAYVEAGKGSGKTPLLAAVGLLGLVADGEAAAEIYSAATTREQAGISFRDAKLLAAAPALARRLDIGQYVIQDQATDSFFRPVSSEHRGLDGKRPHMALIDEVHEHPTAMVVDKMRAGTKSRKQALIFEITNSGYDRNSVCWHHHEYSMKVLEGHPDDSWFAYVCQLDPCEECRANGKLFPDDACPRCDQWTNEAVWPKANPSLDTILPRKYLREQVHEALGMPSKQDIVKRLNFCVWTETACGAAIPMEKWDAACPNIDAAEWRAATLARLAGKEGIAGLDLGSTSDLTALVLLFREDFTGEKFTALPWFWVPGMSAIRRQQKDRVPYPLWIREGWINETPGDVTDYDQVRQDIAELAGRFGITEIAVDRLFQGAQLCTQLAGDGHQVIAYGQGFFQMAAPTKRFLELVAAGGIEHGNNPVLRWMASNLATESDAPGNLKPSKKRSAEKIDGIVATIMALGRAMVTERSAPEITSL